MARADAATHTTRFRPGPALRGLVLGLSLSVANLAGATLTVLVLGGLGEWTGRQFVGLFGLIEIGTGAAFVVCPNIWRLPAAQAELAPGTAVRFAASTVLIPHWAGGVKTLAGGAMVAWVLAHEGAAFASAGLLLVAAATCLTAIGVSMLAARSGVAWPAFDVFQVVVRRPGRGERVLPAQSLGASVVQFLLNIGAFPAVKLVPPSVLYRPEMAPSPSLLAWALGVAALTVLLGAAAWWGRLSWRAPAPQQKEAEEEFAAA